MVDSQRQPPVSAGDRKLLQLALADNGARSFFRALLDGLLAAAEVGVGAAFSVVRSGGGEVGVRFETLVVRDGTSPPFPPDNPPASLLAAVRRAADASSLQEIPPGEAGNSGSCVWTLLPLRVRGPAAAVAVLFRDPSQGRGGSPNIEAGVRWLRGIAPALAARSLVAERDELARRVNRLERAFTFYAGLLEEFSVNDLALYVVNGLRELVECSRVTLLGRSGVDWKVLAVSGADAVEPGAELVRALVSVFGELQAEAPHVVRNLRPDPPPAGALAQLWEAVPGREHSILVRTVSDSAGEPVFGFLFESDRAEFFRSAGRPGIGENRNVRAAVWFSSQTEPALLAALRRERLPFRRVLEHWRDLRDAGDRPGVRRRRRIRMAALLLLLGSLALPWREHASGNCSLLPSSRAVVVSEVTGRLLEIPVREGVEVEAGAVLARLDTSALETELEVARQDRLRQEAEARRLQDLGEMGPYRVVSHEVERLRQLERRLLTQIERSTIRSPIAGIVLTKDVDLRRGEVLPLGEKLCEVAGTSDWDLRIRIPEEQIGRLITALERRSALPVRYILEARSDLRLGGAVRSPDQISQASEAEGAQNVFAVTLGGIELPQALRTDLRPGYSGRARIELETRPVGVVLTRRFVHFLRMRWIL